MNIAMLGPANPILPPGEAVYEHITFDVSPGAVISTWAACMIYHRPELGPPVHGLLPQPVYTQVVKALLAVNMGRFVEDPYAFELAALRFSGYSPYLALYAALTAFRLYPEDAAYAMRSIYADGGAPIEAIDNINKSEDLRERYIPFELMRLGATLNEGWGGAGLLMLAHVPGYSEPALVHDTVKQIERLLLPHHIEAMLLAGLCPFRSGIPENKKSVERRFAMMLEGEIYPAVITGLRRAERITELLYQRSPAGRSI